MIGDQNEVKGDEDDVKDKDKGWQGSGVVQHTQDKAEYSEGWRGICNKKLQEMKIMIRDNNEDEWETMMGDCNKDKDEGEEYDGWRQGRGMTRRTRTEDKTEDSKDNTG